MSKDTGGPAFPNITPDMPIEGTPGMSLRDHFAGLALPWAQQLHNAQQYEFAARDAYKYADAMLAERHK